MVSMLHIFDPKPEFIFGLDDSEFAQFLVLKIKFTPSLILLIK